MDEPLKDEQESEISTKNATTPPMASPAAKREEEVLAFWERENIFEKTLTKEAPKGRFVFYDGPPFATGLPHYGHILAGTIKDVIPRYKTMRGFRVPRRWGWDCHGLPLENQIEKELNLATKRDIEVLGVEKFNEAARKAVLRYADDWKRIIPRFGRFVDMDNDYRTMDATYTESVWWAFKELHTKGLVYEGFKAMHLCPRCGTTLSNFEVAQGYKDITDLAVTVKLRLENEPNTSLLAWTTTPWTLPGNMAAAVHKDATYIKIKIGEEFYILAKERLSILKGEYTVEKEFLGKELVGKSYEPPFPYFKAFKMEGKEKAWKVYAAPYVTMEDGTGLVHLAPAFGAEDLELAEKEGIPIVHHVDKDGRFVDAVTDFKGLQAKPKDDPQSTDVAIIKYLAAKNLLFAKEKITHSYPHCWRCETPLLNYAASAWFVEVTKFRDKLVSENKKIGWVPKDVGEKRFGNWLQNARDWAISRARYWGAPIPVWRNPKTKENMVIGSLEELKAHTKKSGNTYFIMRHGEASNNLTSTISSQLEGAQKNHHLTEQGRNDIKVNAQSLLSTGIDLIVASPFERTHETAKIVADILHSVAGQLIFDNRLREIDAGVLEGKKYNDYTAMFSIAERFFKAPAGGETYAQVKRRMLEVLYELEQKYQNKRILIISHGDPLWLLQFGAKGLFRDSLASLPYPNKGKPYEFPFIPIPHNENYELDFHRPYIDDIKLIAKDGTHLERVHDVFDCWFESGSMSYAQHHYPFEHTDVFEPKPGWFQKARGYPADFIAEGLDQTRGWFYSLLVLGVGLFGKASYKNVIVNGIVLAEDGQKMSKRLNNYPDPLVILEKYGADAIRYYMLASPLMRAEDLNFSERGVADVASKFIGRFLNVLAFYELYAADVTPATGESTHVLDRWIFARLNHTVEEVGKGMESYELDRASRPLLVFVDDLSTWYVRRSRDRFKDGGEDARRALATLRTILETFSKVSAPFIPFTAEYVYQRVVEKRTPESVHLCAWPSAGAIEKKLLIEMVEVRKVVSLGLEARQKANIKVRQPLNQLTVNSKQLIGKGELLQLIADEVNVKKITVDVTLTGEVVLDATISDALKEEGKVREVVRFVQDLRKKAGLKPKDGAVLTASLTPDVQTFLKKNWNDIARAAALSRFEEGTAGEVLTLEGLTLTLTVRKDDTGT